MYIMRGETELQRIGSVFQASPAGAGQCVQGLVGSEICLQLLCATANVVPANCYPRPVQVGGAKFLVRTVATRKRRARRGHLPKTDANVIREDSKATDHTSTL